MIISNPLLAQLVESQRRDMLINLEESQQHLRSRPTHARPRARRSRQAASVWRRLLRRKGGEPDAKVSPSPNAANDHAIARVDDEAA